MVRLQEQLAYLAAVKVWALKLAHLGATSGVRLDRSGREQDVICGGIDRRSAHRTLLEHVNPVRPGLSNIAHHCRTPKCAPYAQTDAARGTFVQS